MNTSFRDRRSGRTVQVEKKVRPEFKPLSSPPLDETMGVQEAQRRPTAIVAASEATDAQFEAFLQANPLAASIFRHSRDLLRTLKAVKTRTQEMEKLLSALETFVPSQREFLRKESNR